MHKLSFSFALTAALLTAGIVNGQTVPRRANLTGAASPDRGVCTVEVTVDNAAEIEIRGINGTLRNLAGQMPEWVRFDCTGVMPVNAANFRFTGVSGRGSQELVRAPQNGGSAVIRIQDPSSGAGRYVFELAWGAGVDRQVPGGFPGAGYSTDGRGLGDRDARPSVRYTTEQAVRVCQDAVRQQAWTRFHSANIAFRTTTLDDNPGRADWVTGLLDIRLGYDRDETYRFSCSVNFETGEVRSAQLDRFEGDRSERGAGEAAARAAMESCQRAISDNIRERGYPHVDFLSIDLDAGRSGWITGIARADGRLRSDSFAFSCNVDLRDGDVRTIDVRRR